MGWSLKKAFKDAKKIGGAVASSAVGISSFGTVNYDPNTGGIKASADPGDVMGNFVNSATGGKIIAATSGKLAELPTAVDPAVQDKQAEAAANAKIAEQVGAKSKGLSSTVLGGSLNADNSILKKRKLLGE